MTSPLTLVCCIPLTTYHISNYKKNCKKSCDSRIIVHLILFIGIVLIFKKKKLQNFPFYNNNGIGFNIF